MPSEQATRAAIVGIAGPVLTIEEAAMLRVTPPVGVILFARNIVDPAQVCTLTGDLRGLGCAVAIDQEGGRVARLRPPHWPAWPAAADLPGPGAAYDTGAAIGATCAGLGMGIVCAPVADLLHPDGHDVIGDRAYGADPSLVAIMARAMADGLMSQGVVPVAKHAPGHGRAGADSHFGLPVVHGDLTQDILPFQALSDLPWMMTAHILYLGIDGDRPGTLSPVVIDRVIRGQIGFRGVLVTDDLAMAALSGSYAERAAAAIAAGCDVALHCNGDLNDSRAVLDAAGPLTPAARRRVAAGWAAVA